MNWQRLLPNWVSTLGASTRIVSTSFSTKPFSPSAICQKMPTPLSVLTVHRGTLFTGCSVIAGWPIAMSRSICATSSQAKNFACVVLRNTQEAGELVPTSQKRARFCSSPAKLDPSVKKR